MAARGIQSNLTFAFCRTALSAKLQVKVSANNALLAVLDIPVLGRSLACDPTCCDEKLAPKFGQTVIQSHDLRGSFKIAPRPARRGDQIRGRAQCVKGKFKLIVTKVVAKLPDRGLKGSAAFRARRWQRRVSAL
jgi:hypothetical protein